MPSRLSLLFATLLAVPALSTARAQTAPARAAAAAAAPATRLDDYIVETNRATFDRKAPSVTHQMFAADIEALNVPETGDAIQRLPNVFIRKRYIGDKNALTSIRGTSNRQPGRTLVYADGMLLSNLLGAGFGNGPRWFLIAPEEIEKIAVSYGPYSALYAGNSIGGTILVTTRMPSTFTTSAKAQFFTQRFREYATDDTFSGRTAFVSVGDRRGAFSYYAFFNHLKNDSQPMDFRNVAVSATTAPGAGATPATGAVADTNANNLPWILYGSTGPTTTTHDLFKLKLGYDLTPEFVLRYSLAAWRNTDDVLAPETYLRDAAGAPVWGGRVEAAGRTFTIPANAFVQSRREQFDLVNALTLAFEPAAGLHFALTGSLYDTMKDKTYASTISVPAAFAGGPGQATILGRTGWQSLDAKFGWRDATAAGPLAHHALAFGVHHDRYFTTQDQWAQANWRDAASRTALTNGTGGATRTQALFVQDTWLVSPAWTVTTGLRWETWRAFDGFRARDFGAARVRTPYDTRAQEAFSPKFAVAWRPAPGWHARLSLGRAHRFPTLGELFQGSVSASGSITANDPNLSAERARAADLTIERTLGRATLRASLFNDDVRDALVNQSSLRPDGTSFTGNQNIGRVRARGVEFAFNRRGLFAESLDFDVNWTYTEALILANPGLPASVGKRFPRIPLVQWKTMTTWRATPTLALNFATRWSGNQFNTLDNVDTHGGYGGNDNFFVADLKAAWTPVRGTTLSLGCDNLTDRRYHVSHPFPARMFFAEVRWTR
jgi:iron complex outermembrane receptor protein